jgi:hypothetical protein
MLGYGMYGDPAVHITLVEQIAQGSAREDHPLIDSVHAATRDLGLGYPVGSYAWPLFGRVVTGVGAFHLWAPLSALVLALMALVAYALLRTLLMPRALAAAAGTLVGVGHLVYAYHAQGGTKEILVPLAAYTTTALAARALQRQQPLRSLAPAGVTAGAAVGNLGLAGLAWVAPAALVVGGVVFWRARRARSYSSLRPLAWAGALVVVLGLPVVLRTVSFFDAANKSIDSKSGEFANLLGPVPFREAWNVWIAHDYRLPNSDAPIPTDIGVWLAAALCVVGILYALRRRNLAIPLTLIAGAAAVVAITPRASIYYDAKTYVAIAPALGVATAAGLFALGTRRGLSRGIAIVAATLLAIGVLASDAYTYSGVWLTPRFRFEELGKVADHTRGQGPLLDNDFEEWGPYILRDSKPWQERAFRWPYRLLRRPGNFPASGRGLDFDDYQQAHIESFPLLLERKSPDASRPPANYVPSYSTSRYQVWRRSGPPPRLHVPLGFEGAQGTAPLTCTRGQPRLAGARYLFAQARRLGVPVRAAVGPAPPVYGIGAETWVDFQPAALFKPPEDRVGIGGLTSGEVNLPAGRYRAWLRGSIGPGMVMYVRTVGHNGFNRVGYLPNDNSVPSIWHSFGVLVAHGRTVVQVASLGVPFYKAGSQHLNVVGPIIFTREGETAKVVDVPPARAASLCGKQLDWLELPPAATG